MLGTESFARGVERQAPSFGFTVRAGSLVAEVEADGDGWDFWIDNKGTLAWTKKAQYRLKERVREITSRNRGHKVETVIDELKLYIRGWLNYYKLSSTYKEVLALSVWVRRRVRLYYWKQWKQPRTRRRNLLALGADPATVHMATRSRKGYWRMSQNEIVRHALKNRWLEEQGVPDMRAVWIVLHHGPNAVV